MIRALQNDKKAVVNILINSFRDNKSVNYIIRQDKKRIQRIKRLLEYSFDMCYQFGNVFLSNNKKACALILLPDKKKITIRSIFADIKLIVLCLGFFNIKKAMQREAKLKKLHPKEPIVYLWFIGVDPTFQNKGSGSQLLKNIIKESNDTERPIYLETSTLKNIPWYEKFGFTVYNELDFGYKLFCLKRENLK